MAWDHPRGVDPLRAAAEGFRRADGEPVRIEWDARPLREFEDTPIDELARRYDLITVDHPLIGDACRPHPALQDLTELISPQVLADCRNGSLGASFESYRWHGHLYALPVDAAAQVSAYRPDLIGRETITGAEFGPGPDPAPPRTWDELFALVARLPAGRTIALAANPTHLYLSWLSLCHQYAPNAAVLQDGRPDWWTDVGIDPRIGAAALADAYRLLDVCDNESLFLDPIGLLDRMATGDRIAYAPLVFGYCSYGREPGRQRSRHRLRFAGPPTPDGRPIGTVLGGVGLAVSTHSAHRRTAADFLERVAAPDYQRTDYVVTGGQPAAAEAWADAAANRLTNDFFRDSQETVGRGFLRPRGPGYPSFQITAGRMIHQAAVQRSRPGEVVSAVNEAWSELCCSRS